MAEKKTVEQEEAAPREIKKKALKAPPQRKRLRLKL